MLSVQKDFVERTKVEYSAYKKILLDRPRAKYVWLRRTYAQEFGSSIFKFGANLSKTRSLNDKI